MVWPEEKTASQTCRLAQRICAYECVESFLYHRGGGCESGANSCEGFPGVTRRGTPENFPQTARALSILLELKGRSTGSGSGSGQHYRRRVTRFPDDQQCIASFFETCRGGNGGAGCGYCCRQMMSGRRRDDTYHLPGIAASGGT
jgi:hypothetical protein